MPLFSAWSVVSALHPSKQTKKQQQYIQHTNFAILQVCVPCIYRKKTFIEKKVQVVAYRINFLTVPSCTEFESNKLDYAMDG